MLGSSSRIHINVGDCYLEESDISSLLNLVLAGVGVLATPVTKDKHMTIFALKAPPCPEQVEEINRSLQGGEGRFGWSYVESADLRQLADRIERNGWDSLNNGEKDCYRGQEFLLSICPNDYVVYVNVPSYGRCTVARVTGCYEWRYEDKDFNHRFAIDVSSLRVFDRNDARVHPDLSDRLKRRGRQWRVYAEPEFRDLLNVLKGGAEEHRPRTPEVSFSYLQNEAKEHLDQIADRIHHTYPRKDLEELIAATLKRVPGVKRVEHMKGRADRGADLEVKIETIPLLVQKLVVQVKSYEGEISGTKAVEDIANTIDDADMGLIVSTATSVSDGFRDAMGKLEEKKGKPVRLLYGSELAHFVLKYMGVR